MTYSIKYPRKEFIRRSMRFLTGNLFSLLATTKISGLDKFPQKGPLIVVGNHTGAVEVVLMGLHSPRIVEFMGAMDIPWNGWMGKVVDLYGVIPVHRGYTSNATMKMGIDVLRQDGVLGIFPEGGFWEPGKQKAQTGPAWLSYMAKSPILPIGFGDTRGKLSKLLHWENPSFEMNIGDVLPPVQLNGSTNKKDALQQAADQIMEKVWDLVPEDEKKRKESPPENEIFTLEIALFDFRGEPVSIPPELSVLDGSWISRFAHRPNLINSIRDYVFTHVQVLKELDRNPSAKEIHAAAHSMVEYVERENPQYFNFRYGYKKGNAFHQSFRQLRDLMKWAMDNDYRVVVEARYEYIDVHSGERIILNKPGELEQW